MPGVSGTPAIVTLASDTSCTTAETMACSMDGSSSITQVPGSQVNAERTCNGTRHVRANSTERMAGFGQPQAHISRSSSKLMRLIRRARGTTLGSAVNTPETSVYSSQASAPRAWARATAVVSEPPRPRKVTSRPVETPWAPPTTGTLPSSSAARMRSGRISTILAFMWLVSVTKPAWLPVKLSAATPAPWSAMQSSAMALRSPAVTSMSISRPGRTRLTSVASRSRSSVSLPIADTTTTTRSPWRQVLAMWSTTSRIRSASATDVPPNFWTSNPTGAGRYRPAPGGQEPVQAVAGPARSESAASPTRTPQRSRRSSRPASSTWRMAQSALTSSRRTERTRPL